MLATEYEMVRQELAEIAAAHDGNRSALIPMLQKVQGEDAHISELSMQIIADVLDIHPVEVYGVASFYHFLNIQPKGAFVVRLCRTVSCEMQGKDRVARQLESDLGIRFGERTPDSRFTLEWCNCLGQCDEGPALMVNEVVHTRVTPESVSKILEECRSAFGVHARQRKETQSL